MAGETIIVADDQPVRLRLTQAFLSNEGYRVVPAVNGNEAAKLLGALKPDAVFIDLNSAAETSDIAHLLKGRDAKVFGLAAASQGDEPRALAEGWDAALARPVQMNALGGRLRELFAPQAGSANELSVTPQDGSDSTAAPCHTDSSRDAQRLEAAAELEQLRTRFLSEGLEKLRNIERQIEGRFDAREASKAVHQWIGTGGLLGFAAISRLARDAEKILAELPLDTAQFRETLTQLSAVFASPGEAREAPLPPSILEALDGKTIAAVEFTAQQQERLSAALERVHANAVFLAAAESPESDAALGADILLVHAAPEALASRWLDPSGRLAGRRPVILTGSRDELAALPQAVQALAREFLMDSWQAEEALVRLSLAAANRPQGRVKSDLHASLRTQVVIADDDPAVLSLVRAALENFGMQCHVATNGEAALAAVRTLRPHAAVLDVNMPGKDGYEVLAAIRHEDLPVRVLLLTARQQESDIVRGFTLGADDYVVKPFSPMELVARLKRLLSR